MKILTISEMIEQLEAIKKEEGDIGVVVENCSKLPYEAIDDMIVRTVETEDVDYNNSSIFDPIPPKQLRCVVLI